MTGTLCILQLYTHQVGFRHHAVEDHRDAAIATHAHAVPRANGLPLHLVVLEDQEFRRPLRSAALDTTEHDIVRGVSRRGHVRFAHVVDLEASCHARQGGDLVADGCPVVPRLAMRLTTRGGGEHLAAQERLDIALPLVRGRNLADRLHRFQVHLVAHRRRRTLFRDFLDDQAGRHQIKPETPILLRHPYRPQTGVAQGVQ